MNNTLVNNNITFNGCFNLILGNMFSGKTTELMRRYRRYTIGGKKCFLVKYKNDVRYDKNMIASHDNVKVMATSCEKLCEVDTMISNYDVICIDEIQFYTDAQIFCEKWANEGKIVEACGLSGTFNRTLFPVISELIPLAENVKFLKAICADNGNEASFTKLLSLDNDNIEQIGGAEKYKSVDRKTYFENNVTKYKESLDDLLKLKNISD